MSKSIYELETENLSIKSKLQHAVALLKQTRFLVIKRKQEIQALKEQLASKNQLLLEEMLAHERTNQRLANALHRLAQEFSQTAITTHQELAPRSMQHEDIDNPVIISGS